MDYSHVVFIKTWGKLLQLFMFDGEISPSWFILSLLPFKAYNISVFDKFSNSTRLQTHSCKYFETTICFTFCDCLFKKLLVKDQKQSPEVLFKKRVFLKFLQIHWKIPVLESPVNKVFSVKFARFLRTPILRNHDRTTISLLYKTSARHEETQCDTTATHVQNEWHSATRLQDELKTLTLITIRVKTCFHIIILALWQMKDYKQMNNLNLRTSFWKCFAPILKCVWKVHHKNWTL